MGDVIPIDDLPRPDSARFRPLRAGIVNVWQYDDQEFRFHHGRLILRGENAAGKSKALEVLLPFLLDADLAAYRLDPFGSQHSKSMRWNLLENGIHPSRLGYTWIELGRVDESGAERVVTLGAGLRATESSSGADSWYFTTSLRPGRGFHLVTPDGTPLTKEALRRALGEDGSVYDRGREYREKVDKLLFGLGPDRYATLVDLLLKLRRPQLSAKLDPSSLSELLTESLPPLDAELVGQLSEGFERLEREETELSALRLSLRAVSAFIDEYRVYARGEARRRSGELRQAETRYHNAAERVRAAAEALGEAEARLTELGREQAELATAIAEARGQVSALEASEAMRTVESLRALERHAAQLAEVAERAEAELVRAARENAACRAEWEREAARAEERRAKVPPAEAAAEAGAREAGLAEVHAGARPSFADDPSGARAAREKVIAARLAALEELRALQRALDQAQARLEAAENRRRDADDRVRADADAAGDARRRAEQAREALDAAILSWAAGLENLALPGNALDLIREAASRAGEEGAPDPAAVLAGATAPQQQELAARIARLEVRIAGLDEQVRALDAEIERVDLEADLPPPPPFTRGVDRTGRLGAPLYLLCDFAPDLDEPARAGLEAALQAAGLLDAWVTPEGRVLGPGTLDTVLVPDPIADGPTLAAALVPTPGHGVTEKVAAAVLRSIGLGEGPSGPWVSPDGSWRLGPLHGAWVKQAPEHVGASAREAARRRRLAELAGQRAALAAEWDRSAAERDEALALRRRIAGEIAALPSASELVRSRSRADEAAEAERRSRRVLSEAEAAVASHRAATEAAGRALHAAAEGHGLAGAVADLDGFARRLGEYRNALRDLASFAELARDAARAAEASGARLASAEGREASARAGRERAGEGAAHARAEVETLRATVGAEVEEVLARHARAVRRVRDLEERREAVHAGEKEAVERRGRARGEHEAARGELEERTGDRRLAADRVKRLAQAGFLPLALAEPPSDGPEGWTLTRTLDLARAVEASCADAPSTAEAISASADRTHRRFMTLTQDLGTEFRPSFELDDQLIVVRVAHNGVDHDVVALRAVLAGEQRTRQDLLQRHERELLRRFLLGEVGSHVRARLREAHELVADMNAQLRERPTASRMVLSLRWEPASGAAEGTREAIELLRRHAELLSDADREALARFFQECIAAARSEMEAGSWREHLATALDYRRWHRFRVLKTQDGRTTELTQREHAAGSGGEKSVALHLPLFAAAAAHYRSALATAPRLVLLDEAFAGIDQGMRGRCMGLLVAFDLDFLMTSHEEWGCYEELPGVATYHLYRDPGLRGVAAERFVWNGERLVADAGEAPAALP